MNPTLLRPRAVHFTTVHPALDNRIFHKECKSLAMAGLEVVLITSHDREEVLDGVRLVPVRKVRLDEHLAYRQSRLSRMTTRAWAVYREALRQRGDIYHFHDPELIPVGLLLRMHGKRVIYDVHEDLPQDILPKHYIPRWLRKPLALAAAAVENVAGRFFSGIVPATPTIAARFSRINRATEVVRNYPREDEMGGAEAPPPRHRANYVGFVGVICHERGIREMVEAIGLVDPQLDARLQLIGFFSPPELESEVRSLPGWQKVDYLGYKSRAELGRILPGLRAGIVVFHKMHSLMWSEPNKLFEYMAAGIPVIAADFPLWREIVTRSGCGLLADPLQPRAIAAAIERVLRSPEEAEAMGAQGRVAVARTYNWESQEANLLRLYALLLRDRMPMPACPAAKSEAS